MINNWKLICSYFNLYENECESDVILLVGDSNCQERIPAHTWVLALGSDYFNALFSYSHSKEYKFPDDDVHGFNNMIRYFVFLFISNIRYTVSVFI